MILKQVDNLALAVFIKRPQAVLQIGADILDINLENMRILQQSQIKPAS